MATFRIQIDGTTIYEGAPIAVPHVGEDIHHGGQVVRIEAVTWDFTTAGTVQVTLVVGERAYTF
jgi:hypothetical protein